MQKLKKRFISAVLYVFVFLLLEIIVIYISSLLPYISENKLDLSISKFSHTFIMNILGTLIYLIESGNPLFILGTIFIIGYMIYYNCKSRDKNYQTVGDKYAVHGSSFWMNPKELTGIEGIADFSIEEIKSNWCGGKSDS